MTNGHHEHHSRGPLYHCWWGCDTLNDALAEAAEDFQETKLMPIKDRFVRAELEEVGAVIEPLAQSDAFTRFTQVMRAHGTYAVPAKSVMEASEMSIAMLLRDNKVDGTTPKWVRSMGFAGGNEITKGLTGPMPDNIHNLRIWGRNDVHGTQYFASCVLPKVKADDCHHRLWRSTGIQHVYCTDDAPYAVVHQLSGHARLEYHRIPSAHMLSGITALGFQYDCREALVLVQKRSFNIAVAPEKSARLHLVWMKSIRHPSLPVGNNHEVAADMVAASMMKSYSSSHHLHNSQEVQQCAGGKERAVIRVRAIGFYTDPDSGETICVNFGHEDSAGGITDAMGKAQYLLSMGFSAGGIDQIVKFQMERLAHILPSGSHSGFYATGPFSTEWKAEE
jgi:hypothetical protein